MIGLAGRAQPRPVARSAGGANPVTGICRSTFGALGRLRFPSGSCSFLLFVWVREMKSTESGGGIAPHTTMGMCTTTFWVFGRLGFQAGSSSFFFLGLGTETKPKLAHEHFRCSGA